MVAFLLWEMGLPLWVDVKMHKAATNSMEPKGRPWLHEPHGGKKAVSNKTNKKNGGRKNGRWAYPIVDVKIHKAAQNSMEPKGCSWLHGPCGGKKLS